jgi:hypothetical protein
MRWYLRSWPAGVTATTRLLTPVIWPSPGTIFLQTRGASIAKLTLTMRLSGRRMASRGGLRATYLRNSGRILKTWHFIGPTKVELLSSLLTGNHKRHHVNQTPVMPSIIFSVGSAGRMRLSPYSPIPSVRTEVKEPSCKDGRWGTQIRFQSRTSAPCPG